MIYFFINLNTTKYIPYKSVFSHKKNLWTDQVVTWYARDSEYCSFKNKAYYKGSKKPITVRYTKIGEHWFAQVVHKNKRKRSHCFIASMTSDPYRIQQESYQRFRFD